VLTEVAEGVAIHVSRFLQSNTVVVAGDAGALVVDPGITVGEMACLANDLHGLGQQVVAGFATHPHWDHLLWDPQLGPAPRYGTSRCAATARERLSDAGARARVVGMLPPDLADQIPLDLLGLVAGLPDGTTQLPWDGPHIRVVEHGAHAPGHAAVLVEERGVLAAGDMLSDVLVPMLDVSAADPIGDYLAALRLLEAAADDVDVVIPGHGSVADTQQARARIELDRAYLQALRDGHAPDDPRIEPSGDPGSVPVSDVHTRQAQTLAERGERGATHG
jgi:glyoxylase-like metal-dependent hydrolase (beta-lactamase superfamily II)